MVSVLGERGARSCVLFEVSEVGVVVVNARAAAALEGSQEGRQHSLIESMAAYKRHGGCWSSRCGMWFWRVVVGVYM